MAEVIGLTASIIQIAGAGAKLSSALYHFTTSAVRADQDITDIASDVELTSNALESVGKVFETEDAKSLVSKKAIQDANNIIKRCEAVFNDISELVDKRRKSAKDGKKGLSVIGKLAWPMKEQRVELHKRRLDSLKNSLVLLLHVLQLAQGQARGQLEKDTLEKERDKIRELHQRQQDSLKCLQALETKLSKVALDDEVTLTGSATTSRIPTLDLMLHNPTHDTLLSTHTGGQKGQHSNKINSTDVESDTSDSEVTTTDDEDEHLSLEEIATAAKHVQKLLKRITKLQHTFDTTRKSKNHKKKRVNKLYQRFCRKWEADVAVTRPLQPILQPDREMDQHKPFIPTPRSNESQNLRVPTLPSISEPLSFGTISNGPQDESKARMAVPKKKKASKPRLRIDPEDVNPPAENPGLVERRPLPPPLYLMAPMDIAPRSLSPPFVHAGVISAAIGRGEQYSHSPAYSSSSRYPLRVVDDANKGSESVHDKEPGKLFHEVADTVPENHTEDDPLACNYPACDKIFYRRDILQRHQALHTYSSDWGCEDPTPVTASDFRRKSSVTDSPATNGISKPCHRKGPLPAISADPSDKIALKRARNTLAARESRQRKFEHVSELEKRNIANKISSSLGELGDVSDAQSELTLQPTTAGDIYDEDEPVAETERVENMPRKLARLPTETSLAEAPCTRTTRSKLKHSNSIDQQVLVPPTSLKNGQNTMAETSNTTPISLEQVSKRRGRPATVRWSGRMEMMADEKAGPITGSLPPWIKDEVEDLDFDLEDDICIDLGDDLPSFQQHDADNAASVPQNSACLHDIAHGTSSNVGNVESTQKMQDGLKKMKRSKPIKGLNLASEPVFKRQRLNTTVQANMTATGNYALPDQAVERDIVDVLLDKWTVTRH